MKTILRGLRLYGPYLGRPLLWPEIYRRTIGRLLSGLMPNAQPARAGPEEKQRLKAEATDWCAQHALSNEMLFDHLGIDPQHRNFAEQFKDDIAAAKRRVAHCPIELGGASNLPLIYALCQHLGATRVLETGVAFGWSSLAVLLALKNRSAARLYSIDLPYFDRRNDPWVGGVVPAELRGQWVLYRMADREGVPRALRAAGELDLAHYDSDKSPAGRNWAYLHLWGALRRGGVLISDDVGDNHAFRDFAAHCGVAPYIVRWDNKYLGVLCKSLQ